MTGHEGDPQEIVQEIELYSEDKWYMHKQEAVQENGMHQIFWDFEMLVTQFR